MEASRPSWTIGAFLSRPSKNRPSTDAVATFTPVCIAIPGTVGPLNDSFSVFSVAIIVAIVTSGSPEGSYTRERMRKKALKVQYGLSVSAG